MDWLIIKLRVGNAPETDHGYPEVAVGRNQNRRTREPRRRGMRINRKDLKERKEGRLKYQYSIATAWGETIKLVRNAAITSSLSFPLRASVNSVVKSIN